MSRDTNLNGQTITHQTYEDPEIVEGYIKRNALIPKQAELIKKFATSIHGINVLDLGCGPGHDSYIFSELGFEVTGLDYSAQMIARAETLKDTSKKPHFLVGDMKKLTEYFAPHTFDAIWASASLLHIPQPDIPAVLKGMHTVCKNGAVVYIGLKGGNHGTVLVDEDKLGKPMQREFTLWTREDFEAEVAKEVGWKLENFFTHDGSLFMGKTTQWLDFFYAVQK